MLDGGLGHDTLIGRIVSGAGGSELHGGDGDDRLVVYDGTGNLLDGGAGVDLFTGGTGDDRFRIDTADLTGGGTRVNGQRGIDTVAIDFDLDLTRVADTVFRNIETIDLRDGSGQELALSAADVLAMTDSRRHCTILADQHDTIRLVGNWTAGATSFNTTAYSLDGATLFVDNTDHILIA